MIATIFKRFAGPRRGQGPVRDSSAPKGNDMNILTKSAPVAQLEHGSSLWLHKVIAETTSPRLEVVNLTPQLAKTLLDLNPDNRSIRQTKVRQYAADMAAGRWALNGEPIIVAHDGRLNDGQHRCLAVVEANAEVPIAIMFGIDRDTRLTVDQGGARSAGDFLNMEGVANATATAATARMVIAYERNGGKSFTASDAITSAEIRERVYSDDSLGHSARFGHTEGNYSKRFLAGSMVAFAHNILCRTNRVEAEAFLAKVCRGIDLRMGEPAHTLREKLLAGRLSRDKKAKLILQAWNFHRRGMKKVSASSMDSTLPFPAVM